MKLIKPSEISSKIMTLIDESDEFVILISPYVKISKWHKLLKKLNRLRNRDIPLEFVVRDNKTNKYSHHDSEIELKKLGFNFTVIPDLHCKLYINEKQAIMSSMNLLFSSDTNAIELAYATETEKEYDELIDFCNRYLNVSTLNNHNSIDENWENYATEKLSQKLNLDVNTWMEDSNFLLNTWGERFKCFIWNKNSKENYFRIFGILTQNEFEFLVENQDQIPNSKILNFEVIEGKNNNYNTIWATLKKPIATNSLNFVLEKDKTIITDSIIEFVLDVEKIKSN